MPHTLQSEKNKRVSMNERSLIDNRKKLFAFDDDNDTPVLINHRVVSSPLRQLFWKFWGVFQMEITHITCMEKNLKKSWYFVQRTIISKRKMFKTALLCLFIHSYLNYGNIAWASTTKTNSAISLLRQSLSTPNRY